MRARFVRLSIVAMAASLALAAAAPAPVARGIATEVLDELASRWIVVLEDGVDADDMTSGLLVTHRYEHALNGYAAVLTDATARRLARTPGVLIVERDQQLSITAELPTGVDRIDGDEAPAAGIGSGAAVDVDVAVLDTGIDSGHRDLDVVSHVNCVSTFLGLFGGGGGCNAGGSDGHGHGTHVAGTIGARDNGLDVVGVAPGARLWGVKVLSDAGAGSSSDIIAGIDWVTARADQIEVINMSLGGSGTSSATNSAIQGATNAGVVVVVAAGNDSANASGYTPANAPDVITVSAFSDTDGAPGGNGNSCSGADDSFASYSNYGAVVEIAAPGSCIRSTRAGGGTTSMSGTSMASPHVAGAAALWIAANNVPRNADRRDAVLDGLLTSWSVPQSSECGFTGGRSSEPALHLTACGASPGNEAPAVSITAPADNTTVDEGTEITFTGSASDAEDGDLSGAIEWSSSLDGALGTGSSVAATLTVGTHLVTASVTDTGDSSSSAAVTVIIEGEQPPPPPPPATSATVGSIRWADGSFLFFSSWVDAWVRIDDQDGDPISGATVTIRLSRNGSLYDTLTATTGSNGEAYFANDGVPSGGCWTLEVTAVDASGHPWDGQTPANEYCT